MADEVFISYSHKDQEFVIRLASDLDPQVGGVWFDQSDIRAGDKWRERIAEGIRHCKVFVVVLSPDAVASKYVQDEINQAVERGKRIIPILYRTVKLSGGLADLVGFRGMYFGAAAIVGGGLALLMFSWRSLPAPSSAT